MFYVLSNKLFLLFFLSVPLIVASTYAAADPVAYSSSDKGTCSGYYSDLDSVLFTNLLDKKTKLFSSLMERKEGRAMLRGSLLLRRSLLEVDHKHNVRTSLENLEAYDAIVDSKKYKNGEKTFLKQMVIKSLNRLSLHVEYLRQLIKSEEALEEASSDEKKSSNFEFEKNLIREIYAIREEIVRNKINLIKYVINRAFSSHGRRSRADDFLNLALYRVYEGVDLYEIERGVDFADYIADNVYWYVLRHVEAEKEASALPVARLKDWDWVSRAHDRRFQYFEYSEEDEFDKEKLQQLKKLIPKFSEILNAKEHQIVKHKYLNDGGSLTDEDLAVKLNLASKMVLERLEK